MKPIRVTKPTTNEPPPQSSGVGPRFVIHWRMTIVDGIELTGELPSHEPTAEEAVRHFKDNNPNRYVVRVREVHQAKPLG